MKGKRWILKKTFQGEPQKDDLELQEFELPELESGEVLFEALYLSVDPYMRPLSNSLPPGTMMPGRQVSKVIQSKAEKYPIGEVFQTTAGWRTHHVCNPDTAAPHVYQGISSPSMYKVKPVEGIPLSTYIGVMGMVGATAYFGFLELCEPKEGETVLVSGAAGAVGSLVGQIAKIKGCKVIGFAGTDDKVKYVREELGFDFAYNYKKVDVDVALKEAAPNGIDCYFDNVGGEFTAKVIIGHINTFGRVSVCGSISRYNNDPKKVTMAPELLPSILFKQLTVRGFIVSRWAQRMAECRAQMIMWIQQGKLKYKEHVTEGFENMREAFYGMLKGENIGKALVKA